jgi:hypothetical protein
MYTDKSEISPFSSCNHDYVKKRFIPPGYTQVAVSLVLARRLHIGRMLTLGIFVTMTQTGVLQMPKAGFVAKELLEELTNCCPFQKRIWEYAYCKLSGDTPVRGFVTAIYHSLYRA